MTLFDLTQGEKAIIRKVKGKGSFRKRIIEMGFIAGKEVEVIKKAPLKDPVEYKIMDYFVSLRNKEAQLIEVYQESEENTENVEKEFNGIIDLKTLKLSKKKDEKKTINVAFVGNPNSGKTTIFNCMSGMTERVGNYSGVTVDAKLAQFKHKGYKINVIDLPGTYSITAYTPEELFVRKFIIDQQPDIVINVLDSGNLERNLYLTTQLIDMDIKVIAALNMHDELEKKGAVLKEQELAEMLGIPLIPTVGNKEKGIDELLDKVIDVFEDRDEIVRHIHINYGKDLAQPIDELEALIEADKNAEKLNVSPRFLAIKILEKDKDALKRVMSLKNAQKILALKDKHIHEIEQVHQDCETMITDAKYAFIDGALHQVYQPGTIEKKQKSWMIDQLLTHKILGIPIFLFFMWLTFWATFTLGEYPMNWIEMGIDALGGFVSQYMLDGIFKDLIINGIIGGVGGVLVFIPNIVILYFFVSLMEDTGYMARAVFIMDRLMHKIGLHGKSFIPLLMGFGCNVPAITATRTIESRRDRIITMLITPFMSCSARLPVYILFILAFFENHQTTILFSLYVLGILLAILTSLLLTNTAFKKADLPFVMELPPYRMPTLRSLIKHMWVSAEQYLKKIGGIILIASVIIWVLSYFPRDKEIINTYDTKIAVVSNSSIAEKEKTEKITLLEIEKQGELQTQSYIGRIGQFVQPIFSPMQFDWKLSVGILTGVAAKEVVVSSLGVLYKTVVDEEDPKLLAQKLKTQKHTSGPSIGKPIITPITAFSYMVFVLIYFPCVAVVAAIRKESNKWKYAMFSVFYTTALAWVLSFLTYQLGSWLF